MVSASLKKKDRPLTETGGEFLHHDGTMCFFSNRIMISGQIITTSAEVTLNGGLIRELPQNPLNSGLGIILICPDDMIRGFGTIVFFVQLTS